MSYKTELHCHTKMVSECADLSMEEMVENYVKLGYSTIVITDHFSLKNFETAPISNWEEKCNFYISGYKKITELANGRLNILLGMEFRNIHSSNDYLVFGVTPEFIKKYNTSDENNVCLMSIGDFTKLCHENGMLVYQAHPFRNGMTVIKPGITDGIEVANCHAGHDSRNEIALAWAKKYKLMMCGGSDCHHKNGEGRGGIITNFEIKDNSDLISALRGEFELIYTEE